MAQCENCGGEIRFGKCRECGAIDAHAASGVKGDKPTSCPIDGAMLMANSWCNVGNGYPMTADCPEVCPYCRRTLSWSGACLCAETAREHPGHRYELQDGHWRIAQRGPQTLFTPEQNYHASAIVQAVGARLITVAEGHRILDEISAERFEAAQHVRQRLRARAARESDKPKSVGEELVV